MRFKAIIQILLLAISLNTYSQIVFNNLYDIDSINNSFRTQIELENGDYISANQASNTMEGYFGSYISRIDEFGDVVWEKK